MTLTAPATGPPGVQGTGCDWRAVLPAGRSYAALPSSRAPLIVAERDRQVLDYVCNCLLTGPPRSRAPSWLFSTAHRALGLPGAWRVMPSLPATAPAPRGATETALREWLARISHRLLLLDHSHDPDARFVLLTFAPSTPRPRLALKVAAAPAAVGRIRAERERMRRLDLDRLGALAATVPRLADPPPQCEDTVLATTAVSGSPMLVGYHRPGHTANPTAVRGDLGTALRWLRQVHASTASAPARLGVPEPVRLAAHEHLADDRGLRARVLPALDGMHARMRLTTAPQSLVHGDFWAGNVLLHEGAVSGVVDWERSEPAGSPVRDLARFVLTYSFYLDRHTAPGRAVAGHRGLVADGVGAGVGHALDGAGWYPELVRRALRAGLQHAGVPEALGRDVVLGELAAVAAEASDVTFARTCWTLFAGLSETP